jgi:hypothetical protein
VRAMKDMYMRDLKIFLKASKAWWFQEENRLLWPPFLTLSASPGNDMSCPGSIKAWSGGKGGGSYRARSRGVPKPRDPLRKQRSGCGARVIMTGGRQAAGRQQEGGARAVRGRSNYDICGSLLAINSARNVVLIPPAAHTNAASRRGAHGCNQPPLLGHQ